MDRTITVITGNKERKKKNKKRIQTGRKLSWELAGRDIKEVRRGRKTGIKGRKKGKLRRQEENDSDMDLYLR